MKTFVINLYNLFESVIKSMILEGISNLFKVSK